MGAGDDALQRYRDERHGRSVRTVRTVALVVVLLAAAVGGMAIWMANRRTVYAGPWCVWARPTGGTVPVWGATGATTTTPAFGDVRSTPGGAAVPGNWSSVAATVTIGGAPPWMVSMLQDDQPVSPASLLADHFGGGQWIPTFLATGVQRTSPDGTVWTAFMLESLPPDSTLPHAPNSACAGTWTITTDPFPGASVPGGAAMTLGLLPSGEARNGWTTGTWSVKDGVLAFHDGGALYVGVLADDLQSFDGTGFPWSRAHGTRKNE